MTTTVKDKTILQINDGQQLADYALQERTVDGRKYFIVPAVMMVPGVHAGSRGPLLHTKETIAYQAERWNEIPVVINHPQDGEGNFVSARTKQQIGNAVGVIQNTRYEDHKLRADIWLDEQKLAAASPEALNHIKTKEPLDVSIGVFSQEVAATGEWQGEEYSGIAIDYQPDHLALLPGSRGACSWADGCGIRVNSIINQTDEPMAKEAVAVKDEKPTETKKENVNFGGRDVLSVLRELNGMDYAFSYITNETGYRELMDKIRVKLDSMDNDVRVYFLEDVFEDHFVYRSEQRERPGQTKLYKQEYSILENQDIEWSGDPIEVRREVEYVTMEATTMRRTKGKAAEVIINDKNKGGTSMKDEKEKSPCFVAKVDALIANESTQFSDTDKEWLMAQSEETLAKLEPKVPAKEEKQEEPQINRDQALEVLNLQVLEDFTKLMPEKMRKQVEAGLKLREDTRAATIKDIMANTADVWTEDELKEFPCEKLTKLQKSITQPVDYSGAGAGSDVQANQEADGEEPLMPAGVEKKTK